MLNNFEFTRLRLRSWGNSKSKRLNQSFQAMEEPAICKAVALQELEWIITEEGERERVDERRRKVILVPRGQQSIGRA